MKDSLVVEFVPLDGDKTAKKQLNYDVLMAPLDSKATGTALATSGAINA